MAPPLHFIVHRQNRNALKKEAERVGAERGDDRRDGARRAQLERLRRRVRSAVRLHELQQRDREAGLRLHRAELLLGRAALRGIGR